MCVLGAKRSMMRIYGWRRVLFMAGDFSGFFNAGDFFEREGGGGGFMGE